jgi:hypothetical protein
MWQEWFSDSNTHRARILRKFRPTSPVFGAACMLPRCPAAMPPAPLWIRTFLLLILQRTPSWLTTLHFSKADRERLKQASKALLASLKALLQPMPDWTQKEATQAEVKIFILDDLYGSLPRIDRCHSIA